MINCYDVSCKKDNDCCFTECSIMMMNVLLLKDIQKKIQIYEKLLNEASKIAFHKLKQDFQNIFNKICMDFNNGYNEIIKESMSEMFYK